MNSSESVPIRYPLSEIIVSILVVLVAACLPWQTSSQRISIVIFTALSVVMALAWSFAVRYTPKPARWLHAVLGLAILAAEVFYFGTQPTGILDVLLIPVGLGILIAFVCDLFRGSTDRPNA